MQYHGYILLVVGTLNFELVGSTYAQGPDVIVSRAPVRLFDSRSEPHGQPLVEIQKLTASDAGSPDQFGYSVAVSGDTAVVGAFRAFGAGGGSGAAYVFERTLGGPDNWGEVVKLTASDGAIGDSFGTSVAISADTILVGAPLDDDACTDDDACESGAAYIFDRNQGGADNWGEIKKLTASDDSAGDFFGSSVSISVDTIVVGASGVDNGQSGSGAAYIFERDLTGPLWGEAKKLTASDSAVQFGLSVSLDGDTLVVGTMSGAVYMFGRDRDGVENWGEITRVIASDAGMTENFGHSVALSGDTIVVGADRDDDGCLNSICGSAFVFGRDIGGAENWGEVTKLRAVGGSFSAQFGNSVSISVDTIVVGAFRHHDGEAATGAAFVFSRNLGGADNWGELEELTASDGAAGDEFGVAVSISGEVAIVGAHFDQDVCCSSGSAYVFALPNLSAQIFADGFESGDTLVWSSVNP